MEGFMPLTDTSIKTAKPKEKPYKIFDGNRLGLYIEIAPSGSRFFRIQYFNGKSQTSKTLGRYPIMTLASAREATIAFHRALVNGPPAPATVTLFSAIADAWVAKFQDKYSRRSIKTRLQYLKENIIPC
jgi:hypothetical protein